MKLLLFWFLGTDTKSWCLLLIFFRQVKQCLKPNSIIGTVNISKWGCFGYLSLKLRELTTKMHPENKDSINVLFLIFFSNQSGQIHPLCYNSAALAVDPIREGRRITQPLLIHFHGPTWNIITKSNPYSAWLWLRWQGSKRKLPHPSSIAKSIHLSGNTKVSCNRVAGKRYHRKLSITRPTI